MVKSWLKGEVNMRTNFLLTPLYSIINKEIHVFCQEELIRISNDFCGIISINFGTRQDPAKVFSVYPNAIFSVTNNYYVEIRNRNLVIATGNSQIIALANCIIEGHDTCYISAYNNSTVIAADFTTVNAYESSNIIAKNFSQVIVCDDLSRVEAFDLSRVIDLRCGQSRITAMDKSEIVDPFRVEPELGDNFTLSGKSGWVSEYSANIYEFLQIHGIKNDSRKAIFYKAVHKKQNKKTGEYIYIYSSDYDSSFTYQIGEVKIVACDSNVNNECSYGMHIGSLQFVLEYGFIWPDLAILEVKTDIDDIVICPKSLGKVRTSKIEVLREVPLEECGIYGKILTEFKKILRSEREVVECRI